MAPGKNPNPNPNPYSSHFGGINSELILHRITEMEKDLEQMNTRMDHEITALKVITQDLRDFKNRIYGMMVAASTLAGLVSGLVWTMIGNMNFS